MASKKDNNHNGPPKGTILKCNEPDCGLRVVVIDESHCSSPLAAPKCGCGGDMEVEVKNGKRS